MTKIMFSLQHNDHLIWTSIREVSPELARLMSHEELNELGSEAEATLRKVLSHQREPVPVDRPLVEKKRKR